MARFTVGLSPVVVVKNLSCRSEIDLKKLATILCLLVSTALPSLAQYPTAAKATDPSVGSVNITIPMRSKPTGGNATLGINSDLFLSWIGSNGGEYEWNSGATQDVNGHWTIAPIATMGIEFAALADITTQCGSEPVLGAVYQEVLVLDPNGSPHPLPSSFTFSNQPGYENCPTVPATGTTTDGSGLTVVTNGSYNMQNWTIYDKFGNKYTQSVYVASDKSYTSWLMTDPDNNTISRTYQPSAGQWVWTDKLGQTILTEQHNLGSGGTPEDKYWYIDGTGGTSYYTVTYTPYTNASAFGCNTTIDGLGLAEEVTQTVYFPTGVSIPGGGSYIITWENEVGTNKTGRLASLTAPNGTSEAWSYSGGINNLGEDCNAAIPPKMTITKTDATTGTTTFTYTNNRSSEYWNNFLVESANSVDNTKTETYYNSVWDVNIMSLPSTVQPIGQFVTLNEVWQGSSSVLSTTYFCYNGNQFESTCLSNPPSGVAPSSNIVPPITQTDSFSNFGTMTSTNRITQTFDTHGNPLVTTNYDWGGYGGAVLSVRTRQYGSASGTSCTQPFGNYIYGALCTDAITASGNYPVYRYHTYTYNSDGTLKSDALQLNPSLYFTHTYTYNSKGALLTVVNQNNGFTEKTIGYGGSNGCNSLVPTSVSFAVSTAGTENLAWNCAAGKLSQITDVNGNPTKFYYADPFYRLSEIAYPDSMSDVTNFSYSGNAVYPATMSTSEWLNSSQYVTSSAYYDGSGHVIQRTIEDPSSPSGLRIVSYTWNGLGEQTSKTLPYWCNGTNCSPADSTYGYTNYTFDGMGRMLSSITMPNGPNQITTNMTYNNLDTEKTIDGEYPIISEVDGMGRKVLTCKDIGASQQANGDTISSCGLTNISASGFSTKMTYDPANEVTRVDFPYNVSSHEVKQWSYDYIGRKTSQLLPEETAAESWTYDGSLVGALSTHTDSRGIVTTYAFDNIYRPTGMSFSDGTPSVSYHYDVNQSGQGVTGSNLVGRLVMANTSSATNNYFNYDVMGRLITRWEAAPLQWGISWSEIDYAYNFAGDVTSMTDQDSGITLNYALDSVGRVTGITPYYANNAAGNIVPPSIISSATYNGLGKIASYVDSITGYSLPDTVSFLYDNLGRTLASGATYGEGWDTSENGISPIGDMKGGGDNPYWTYGYDSAVPHRLIQAQCLNTACPNGWGTENYTYDEYDNRWTESPSVGSGPNTSFSFNLHNQITSASGTTYDAAGNMTKDTVGNTYTYDALNRLTGENGSSYKYTYDAFGSVSESVDPTFGTKDFIYNGSTYLHMNGSSVKGQNQDTGFGQYDGYESSGTMTYQQNYIDQNGSILEQAQYLTNGLAQGKFIQFLPFGEALTVVNETNPDGTKSDRFWFAGTFNNSGSDDHAIARDYSPLQGRWFSIDPAQSGWNGYTYVHNSPVSFSDRSGLFTSNEPDPGDNPPVAEPGDSFMFISLGTSGGEPFMNFNNNFSSFSSGVVFKNSLLGSNNTNQSVQNTLNALNNANASQAALVVVPGETVNVTATFPSDTFATGDGSWGIIADIGGVGAAVSGNAKLSFASSVLSFVSEPTLKNFMLNALSNLIPSAVEGSDVPVAYGFAAYDGSQFVANQVIIPVFTPDASQAVTIDANGYSIPNPQATLDSGQFGPN